MIQVTFNVQRKETQSFCSDLSFFPLLSEERLKIIKYLVPTQCPILANTTFNGSSFTR